MLSLAERRWFNRKCAQLNSRSGKGGRKTPGRFLIIVVCDALGIENGDDLMRAGVDDEDLVRD